MHTTCPTGPARRAVRIDTPPSVFGWPVDSRSHDSLRRTRLTFLAVSAAFLLGACDGSQPGSARVTPAQSELNLPTPATPRAMPEPEGPYSPIPRTAPAAPGQRATD